MQKSIYKALWIVGLASFTLVALADQKAGDQGGRTMKKAASASTMAEGEVEDVDLATPSITLRHGPIKSKTMEMEPMTMPFAVKDAALLAGVKAGDKVKFIAEYLDGFPTIVTLQVLR
ncbi:MULTISPECIES: copper-binding protein [Noviherbaspirillum]|jgi:Cu/Ag efflux protein CusF|uniref:copper-binding protein n=1 Tax=Noviherbaspirillum TaxID=1344552 RepID=UPI00124DD1ED|nr:MULTISPECIES: copper-binding protein [Noviherbaspirillum]